MKKKLFAISLMTAILLAGCGKVREVKQTADPTIEHDSNVVEEVTADEDEVTDRGYLEKLYATDFKFEVTVNSQPFDTTNCYSDEALLMIIKYLGQHEMENRCIQSDLFPEGRDDYQLHSSHFEVAVSFGELVDIRMGDTMIEADTISLIKKDNTYIIDLVKTIDTESGMPELIASALEFDGALIDDLMKYLEPQEWTPYEEIDVSGFKYAYFTPPKSEEYYILGEQHPEPKDPYLPALIRKTIALTNYEENVWFTDEDIMDPDTSRNNGFYLHETYREIHTISLVDKRISYSAITMAKYGNDFYFKLDLIDPETGEMMRPGYPVRFDKSFAVEMIESVGLNADTLTNDFLKDEEQQGGYETNNGDILTPENIENYQFGFELYNDGHKDCWEKRYDCAKVMLEAIAQPGTDMNVVDLTITPEEHNYMETKGFMTWLKFEEPMNFKVGDTIMTGRSMEILKLDGSYYFYVGEMFEDYTMFEFDSSYIERILAAAGVSVEITGSLEEHDTQTVEEFFENIDLSTTNMFIDTSGKEYSTAEGSNYFITEEQKNEIVMLVLYRLSDTYQQSKVTYLDKEKALSDPSGMYMLFDFGQPTEILVKNLSESDVYVIALAGNAADGFVIQVNNAETYHFDDDIADRIRDILTVTEE